MTNDPVRIHLLKSIPESFDLILDGDKPFDVRVPDRDYRVGDWVKETTDGTVILAVAGDALLGVIGEIFPYYDTGVGAMVYGDSLPYANGVYGSNLSRQSKVGVIPGNGVIWQAMCDDATSATTEALYNACIHENVDMINAAVTGYAHPLIDISTHETATRQLRIIDTSL